MKIIIDAKVLVKDNSDQNSYYKSDVYKEDTEVTFQEEENNEDNIKIHFYKDSEPVTLYIDKKNLSRVLKSLEI